MNHKTMKAEKEFNDNLRKIQHFISGNQVKVLQDIFKGEESKFVFDIARILSGIIQNMPASYETESIDTPDKIVYLHYFHGGSDWYIIEKDKGNPEDDAEAGLIVGGQYQAFGYVILNGDTQNSEWGNVNIQELIENDVEIDFHFEPIKFSELKREG